MPGKPLPAGGAKAPAGGSKLAKVGKGLLRGARFLGPIGLAITGIMGVFDGITAGMEEAKKENSTKMTVMKAATAGVISGLTFGLVEQKTIENALSGMGDNLVKFTNWIYTPGEGSPGGTTSAKLFGISLGFPNISELFKAGWNKLGNFFIGIADWIYTPGAGSPGGTTSAKLFGVSLGFPDIGSTLKAGWDKLGNFFTGIADWVYTKGTDEKSAKLFGFELKFPSIDKGFSISTMISNVVKKIKDFFWNDKGTGILNFSAPDFPDFEMPDFTKLMRTMLTDIFPKEWIEGSTWIGRRVQSIMPQSLLDILTGEIPGAATGGALNAGQPTMVGELGPELIMPSSGGQVMNAQRTSQIQAAGLRRGAGSSGGAPAVVNAPVNTINNSKSNTTVTSTELKHPSPLLASINLAA